MNTKRILMLSLSIIITACNLPFMATNGTGETEPSLTEQPTSSAPPTRTPIPVPEHIIAVRVVNGIGEFYNRRTGEKFVPRGTNYLYMGEISEVRGSGSYIENATFDTNHYDPQRSETALNSLQAHGYNTVRVFITDSTHGVVGYSNRVSDGYMDNLADFLTKAKARDIFVIFTIDWLPGGIYGEVMNRDCCDTFGSTTVQMLTKGGVEGTALLFRDVFKELLERGAPTEHILAYQLRNEAYFDTTSPPFTLNRTVTTANGKSYDMSNKEEWVPMIDEGIVHFIDTVRAEILEVDPTALVTIGFFVPQTPNPVNIGDPRLVETEKAIWESSADFIDLHAYPGFNFTLKKTVENFKINGMEEKPIIMGEFGAFKSQFGTTQRGAATLQDWQIESCQYGFDGWLLWHWDTVDANIWNALDGGEFIAKTLSPLEMPDPCRK
jgi:hypothetical protein